jgi:hypothetical protein
MVIATTGNGKEALMQKSQIVQGVKEQAIWWLDERLKKISSEQHGSMEVNPFMAPLIAALHGHDGFGELAEFLIVGHFAIGHATGFGKLVDEKILPRVFGTTKLDRKTRETAPLNKNCFDNIDHIVTKNNQVTLLSQKASKWTIQLGQAVELNKSFQELVQLKKDGSFAFDKIIVATFYGKKEELSDKYRILRGINTGAQHGVVDLTRDVEILAGRDFWSWIGGDDDTQNWVMEGVTSAIDSKQSDLKQVVQLMKNFRHSFADKYKKATANGGLSWQVFLSIINGE